MKEKNKTLIVNICCDADIPTKTSCRAMKRVSDVTNGGVIVN